MTYLDIWLYISGAAVTYALSRETQTNSRKASVICAVIWPVIGSLGLVIGAFRLIKSKVSK